MKHLLVLGTIAALAISTTAEAKGHKEKKAARQMVTRQQVYNTGTTRFAPARTSTVVQRYSNGGGSYGRGSYNGRYYGGGSYGSRYYGGGSYGSRYYGGGYYGGGGYPYYGSGSSISIGIGSGYYGSGYGYGYPYYNSGYGGYPYGYNSYGSSYSRGYNVVAEVQQRLARAGYYHGVIDGVAGRRTSGAIARWESSHGIYADGRIDRQLLRSLGLS